MGFFTTRERAELGKSADIRVQGKVRELVRRDFAPRRRPTDHERPLTDHERRPADPERRTADHELAGHVGSLMQRVAETSLQEIDELIVELRRRREQLLKESARVQREIIEYAKLSQSTMQSTKIITESLMYLNKVPDAPRITELHVEDISNAEHREFDAEQRDFNEEHRASNEEHRDLNEEHHASNEEHRDLNQEHRHSGAEVFAQHSEDHGTFGGEGETTAVPGGPTPTQAS